MLDFKTQEWGNKPRFEVYARDGRRPPFGALAEVRLTGSETALVLKRSRQSPSLVARTGQGMLGEDF